MITRTETHRGVHDVYVDRKGTLHVVHWKGVLNRRETTYVAERWTSYRVVKQTATNVFVETS